MNRSKNKSFPSFVSKKSRVNTWMYFLGAVFGVLILSPLFQKGCFIDGMLYKTVAYNYAEGLNSFWAMKFTNTSMSQFCEQPPLYFYLLGNFYKVTGEYYFTDRVFTLVLFVGFIFLLRSVIWLLFKNPGSYLLLGIFFLLAIPVYCWSYVNQVIEPLLCVLIGCCILFFVKLIHSGKSIFALLFILTLYLLFLGKGFQSCFMIVLPIAYVITSKVRRVGYYAILISTVFFLAILLAFLKWYAPANVWMECYYKARLVLTMNNVGNTTEDHFEIIGRFFSELIVCLACVVILCAYLKFKKNYPLRFIAKNFVSNKLALSLLLTAFAGSFPYALSLVQRGFYLIPAFICFVLAIVYGLRRYWMFFFLFTGKIAGFKFTRILFPFIASASLIYFCFSFTLYKRNEQLLKDIDMILPYLKKGEIVLIEGERWNDFSLHSYLYMAKQVSLSMNKKECKFLIRSKSAPEQNTTTFAKLELKSGEIDLYVLKE